MHNVPGSGELRGPEGHGPPVRIARCPVRPNLDHRSADGTARVVALLAPTGLFVVAAIVLALTALKVRTFQPDELIYVTQGRAVADDFPGALWNTAELFQLGPQRLNALFGAISSALFDTGGALAAHKVLNATAFASIVWPVFVLARGLGLGRWWALLPAALAVAVPWVPLATSWLNEPVAYPAFAWATYGAWRASVRPGVRGDLVGLGLVVLAVLARTNLVILVVPLAVAVVVGELRWERSGSSWRAARGAARRHVVLLAAAVLGLLVVLSRGTSSLGGVYTVDVVPPLDVLFDKSGQFLSFLTEGLLVVPLAFAAAWIVRHLVRPLDRERHAFAVVALAAAVALLYSLNGGVLQERYVMYLAWLPLLLMVVGVARRDTPALLVAGSAVLFALLVATSERLDEPSPFATFANPAQTLWARVVEGQGSVRLPGALAEQPVVVALVVLVAGATLVAVLLRRGGRAARVAGASLLAFQLAAGLSTSVWAMDKYVTGAGNPDGPGFRERAWVDGALREGEQAEALVAEPSEANASILGDIAFYNRQVTRAERSLRDIARTLGPDGMLDTELPEHMLVSTDRLQSLGIAGRRLATSPTVPVALLAPERPPRATWRIGGVAADGWLAAPADEASLRTWRNCLSLTVVASPDQPARVVLREPGARPVVRAVPTGRTVRLRTRRPGRATLAATGSGSLPPDRPVSVLLTGLEAVPCP